MFANIDSLLKHRGLSMTEGNSEFETCFRECMPSDILEMWRASEAEEFASDKGISKLAVMSLWLD